MFADVVSPVSVDLNSTRNSPREVRYVNTTPLITVALLVGSCDCGSSAFDWLLFSLPGLHSHLYSVYVLTSVSFILLFTSSPHYSARFPASTPIIIHLPVRSPSMLHLVLPSPCARVLHLSTLTFHTSRIERNGKVGCSTAASSSLPDPYGPSPCAFPELAITYWQSYLRNA